MIHDDLYAYWAYTISLGWSKLLKPVYLAIPISFLKIQLATVQRVEKHAKNSLWQYVQRNKNLYRLPILLAYIEINKFSNKES